MVLQHGSTKDKVRIVTDLLVPLLAFAHNSTWLVYFFVRYAWKMSARIDPFIRWSVSGVLVANALQCFIIALFTLQLWQPVCRIRMALEGMAFALVKCSMFTLFTFRVDTVFLDSFLRYDSRNMWILRVVNWLLTIFWCVGFGFVARNERHETGGKIHCALKTRPSSILPVSLFFDLLFSVLLLSIYGRKIYLITLSYSSSENADRDLIDVPRESALGGRDLRKLNSKTQRLARAMQHHSTLYAVYALLSAAALMLADTFTVCIVLLCVSSMVNVWCAWGTFKKLAFRRYCGPLMCLCKPCWRVCIRNYDSIMADSKSSFLRRSRKKGKKETRDELPGTSPSLSLRGTKNGTNGVTTSSSASGEYFSSFSFTGSNPVMARVPTKDRADDIATAMIGRMCTVHEEKEAAMIATQKVSSDLEVDMLLAATSSSDGGGSSLAPSYLHTEYQRAPSSLSTASSAGMSGFSIPIGHRMANAIRRASSKSNPWLLKKRTVEE